MAVVCPYCDEAVPFRATAAGDYRPLCPKCLRPFALNVPTDAAIEWRVRPLAVDGFAITDTNHGISASPKTQVRIGHAGKKGSAAIADPSALARTNPDLRESVPLSRLSARIGKKTPPTAKAAPVKWEPPEPNAEEPVDIRGYRIEKEIGRGGMGNVYLARQLSLGRPVALKVMSKEWAADPVFVARFTREAYAAAQLSHPNIVRIFDIGEAEGTQFFSMEYVPGESLADLVKRQGKLDPETAVGYVLQAARGLKHAHDRGMIHRDVKPDNLLLDDQGVVKVADLGLVKTWNKSSSEFGPQPSEYPPREPAATPRPKSDLRIPNTGLTGARIALGTPAYMSPEQCRDAAKVDHRADIYSLGCTLYVLVTGRPPFDANTAVELMTKQAYEPIVPPEQIASRVPREVSAIIQKMMAKEPGDRYTDMGEVVRTLENWLGVWHMGTFTPRENQIGRVEEFANKFSASALCVFRSRVIGFFFAALVVGVVLLTFFGQFMWAFGLVGLGLQTALAYFVIDGVARKGYLFQRTKQFLWGLPTEDWIVVLGTGSLFVLLLAMLNLLWIWCGFGLIGIALAIALRFGLDRIIDSRRAGPLRACEKMMVRMRLQGLSEDELRLFVAKFAGRQWEEFFEALFGYDAKLATRAIITRGESSGPRDRHATWREPIISAMDRIEKARKDTRERQVLEEVELANLLAKGLGEDAAARKAEAAAAAMVRRANRVRTAETATAGDENSGRPNFSLQRLLSGAEASNADFHLEVPGYRPFHWVAVALVGPHIRLALAAVLLALGGTWAVQNGVYVQPGIDAQPLMLDGLPPSWTQWVDSWNVIAAGVLLIASLFGRGTTAGVFAILGAAVVVFGHRCGIRPVEPFREYHVALMLGSIIALIGFRLGKR